MRRNRVDFPEPFVLTSPVRPVPNGARDIGECGRTVRPNETDV